MEIHVGTGVRWLAYFVIQGHTPLPSGLSMLGRAPHALLDIFPTLLELIVWTSATLVLLDRSLCKTIPVVSLARMGLSVQRDQPCQLCVEISD